MLLLILFNVFINIAHKCLYVENGTRTDRRNRPNFSHFYHSLKVVRFLSTAVLKNRLLLFVVTKVVWNNILLIWLLSLYFRNHDG